MNGSTSSSVCGACRGGRIVVAALLALVATPGCAGSEGAASPEPTASAATAPAATTPVATAPAATTPATTTGPGAGLIATFAQELDQALADEFAASPELRGYLMLVRIDDGSAWSAAAGDASVDASFRIASVTKMFTAAAVLRLVEEGRLSLDDPLEQVLTADTVDLLRTGGYDPSSITVHHVLTHTSGLLDFTFAPELDFVGTVFADPQHRWTRREQLELAMRGAPVGEPGAQYHYSDTGYALLGEIVELGTGTTLGAGMRDLLGFDRLGIDHTYQESIDPLPPGQPARLHQWFGDVDTYDWHPSLDLFGGGGLVSTMEDLATFVEALLGGKVFEQPGTLAAMLTVPATNSPVSVPGNPNSLAAAAGIFRTDVVGHPCWGHDGFWGVQVLRCDDLGLTVVVSRSQATPPPTYTGAIVGGVLLDLIGALDRTSS